MVKSKKSVLSFISLMNCQFFKEIGKKIVEFNKNYFLN